MRLPAGVGLRALAGWQATWKSELIRAALDRRRGVFIDVGANVGQTLLDYVASGAQSGYLGFEPIPACAAYAQHVIDNNGLDRCALVPVGLSDVSGVLPIFIPREDSTSATLLPGLRPTQPHTSTHIGVHEFDRIAGDLLEGRSISLIKIDVEGAEGPAIRGMRNTLLEHRPPVLCEVLYADRDADMAAYAARTTALSQLLADMDYTIRSVLKSGFQLAGLGEPLAHFPLRHWTLETAEACDYVLSSKTAEFRLS